MDLRKEQILAKIIAEKLRHFRIYDGANANLETADPVAIITDITARGQKNHENTLSNQFSAFCEEYPGTYTIVARCAGRQQSTKFVALLNTDFAHVPDPGGINIEAIKQEARAKLLEELEVQFLKQKIAALEAAETEKSSYHATMKAVGIELVSKLFTKKAPSSSVMQGADMGGQGAEGLEQYTTMLVQALGRSGYIRAAEVLTNDAGTRNMIINFLK